MYLGDILIFILGLIFLLLYFLVFFYNRNAYRITEVDKLSISNETLVKEAESKNDKEETLQKLVEEHNKVIVGEFEKIRLNASNFKKVEVTEEIEYDEAIFI